ncbi:KilA-N domain-containing protein [Salmonella enterica]|nr:KilA-N domain-containing protein [Salmonella enterica]EEU3912571.1 KilA-N domain-containing protein [Salmonella enterica]EGY4581970.1 KilA-N domain-containing protein [Salmonella enterica]EGY4586775.1 KilA-N domain-containing protein [Salmonella enterica]EGY9846215.1 KilA-N domain-containing protein [Salmonella enterica]
MNSLMVIDGIEVRRDIQGRYCLNDLHRAAGGEKRHRPQYWIENKQTSELIEQILTEAVIPSLEQNQPVSVIYGGNSRGTYVCKDLVYSYAMWISAAFHLKVIRTFDAFYSNTAKSHAADQIQAGVILLESAARMLNLSNSSKLGAYQKLQKVAGLPDLMPSYAIDAPAGAPNGSSSPTFSISALLKQHGIRMTANQAYHQLAKVGVVEQKYRESRSGINGIKKFWSVTPRGCMYGKNITSPVNPRETQPHFFEYRFPELLKLLETAH